MNPKHLPQLISMRIFMIGSPNTLKRLTVLTMLLVSATWCSVWGSDPPDVHTINAKIEKLLHSGQYQSVIDNYSGLHLNDAIFQNRIGYAHDMLGDYDKAIWYYRRATELSPEEPLVWRNLGIAYKNKGDIPKAVVALQFYADRLPEGERKNKVLKWIERNK